MWILRAVSRNEGETARDKGSLVVLNSRVANLRSPQSRFIMRAAIRCYRILQATTNEHETDGSRPRDAGVHMTDWGPHGADRIYGTSITSPASRSPNSTLFTWNSHTCIVSSLLRTLACTWWSWSSLLCFVIPFDRLARVTLSRHYANSSRHSLPKTKPHKRHAEMLFFHARKVANCRSGHRSNRVFERVVF
jgi:hypothetical protein